jgi:hypothetical protein
MTNRGREVRGWRCREGWQESRIEEIDEKTREAGRSKERNPGVYRKKMRAVAAAGREEKS